MINDIALFSGGSYTVNDMWSMPINYVLELQEAIIEKADKEKEAIERANNKNKQVF
jgi:hypothetical protein